MKLLALAVVLVACRGGDSAKPDRWPEVERLSTPAIPGGDGALLDEAIKGVQDNDIPEKSLETAVAWRKAGGGVPWRTGHAIDDRRPMAAFKIGVALIERRASDPEATLTALYLAQRMRAESPALIDVAMGFELAKKVVTRAQPATEQDKAFAPTDGEVRRGLAADAVHFVANLRDLPNEDEGLAEKMVRKHHADMVVGAPAERAAFIAHIDAVTQKAQKTDIGKILAQERLPKLVEDMFATVDAYRAWAGP